MGPESSFNKLAKRFLRTSALEVRQGVPLFPSSFRYSAMLWLVPTREFPASGNIRAESAGWGSGPDSAALGITQLRSVLFSGPQFPHLGSVWDGEEFRARGRDPRGPG